MQPAAIASHATYLVGVAEALIRPEHDRVRAVIVKCRHVFSRGPPEYLQWRRGMAGCVVGLRSPRLMYIGHGRRVLSAAPPEHSVRLSTLEAFDAHSPAIPASASQKQRVK